MALNESTISPSERALHDIPRRYVVPIALFAILAGMLLRVHDIDRLDFWLDEVIHTAYAMGFSERDLAERVQSWNAQPVAVSEFLAFQRLEDGRGPLQVIEALAREEPQSAPVHYVAAHFWAMAFGTEATSLRSLSLLIGILLVPALFWMCREICESATVAWVAASLAAASPSMILYSLEFRYYSLWALMIALTTALLFRAERMGRAWWAVYAITCAVALYSHVFMVAIIAAQGAYLFAVRGFRLDHIVKAWVFAATAAAVLFLPWAANFFLGDYTLSDFRREEIPLLELIFRWAHNVRYDFVDLVAVPSTMNSVSLLALAAPILVCSYAVLRSGKRVWLLIAVFLLCVWLPLAAADLARGGIRSTLDRYWIGIYIALILLFAVAIARGLDDRTRRAWRAAALVLWMALLVAGLASGWASTNAPTWRTKGYVDARPAAALINAAESPLLVVEVSGGGGRGNIGLARSLSDNAMVLAVTDLGDLAALPAGYSDYYFTEMTDHLVDLAEAAGLAREALVHIGYRDDFWRAYRPD